MKRNTSYLVSLTPALLCMVGMVLGGLFTWMNLVYTLGVLALVEFWSGENKNNQHTPENDWLPMGILYSHAITVFATMGYLLYLSSKQTMLNGSWVGAIISVGVLGGTSATVVAHELIHKSNFLAHSTGRLLLWLTGNIHFHIHHLQIHHRWIGTSKDAATAKRGESLYAFFARTWAGQIKEAYQLEKKRIHKKGKNNLWVQWWSNEVLRLMTWQIFTWILIAVFLGGWAWLAWMVHTFISSFLLEYVNYIEHYGLERAETDRVGIQHSWQCDKMVSRFFLLDLSRHSDHHYHAGKSYHTLSHHEGSPVLPGGYASLFYPAIFPSWWFRITEPLLPQKK